MTAQLTTCVRPINAVQVRNLLPFLQVIVAIAMGVSLSGPALADKGEWELAVGLGTHLGSDVTEGMTVAPTAQVGVTASLTDYWQLGLGFIGGAEVLAPNSPMGQTHVILDARFVLDALQWVPYVTFGVGALIRESEPDWRTDLTGHIGLGVTYRPSRKWGVGIIARYHIALTDLDRTTGPVELSFAGHFYLD